MNFTRTIFSGFFLAATVTTATAAAKCNEPHSYKQTREGWINRLDEVFGEQRTETKHPWYGTTDNGFIHWEANDQEAVAKPWRASANFTWTWDGVPISLKLEYTGKNDKSNSVEELTYKPCILKDLKDESTENITGIHEMQSLSYIEDRLSTEYGCSDHSDDNNVFTYGDSQDEWTCDQLRGKIAWKRKTMCENVDSLKEVCPSICHFMYNETETENLSIECRCVINRYYCKKSFKDLMPQDPKYKEMCGKNKFKQTCPMYCDDICVSRSASPSSGPTTSFNPTTSSFPSSFPSASTNPTTSQYPTTTFSPTASPTISFSPTQKYSKDFSTKGKIRRR